MPSCEGGRCGGDHTYVIEAVLSFNVLDKRTKENLLYIATTDYFYDTVRLYRTNWTKVDDNETRADGLFILPFGLSEDKQNVGPLIERRFYLYFNHADTDTIDLSFILRLNDCSNVHFEQFSVAYNDSVYFDGKVGNIPTMNFLKKIER